MTRIHFHIEALESLRLLSFQILHISRVVAQGKRIKVHGERKAQLDEPILYVLEKI